MRWTAFLVQAVILLGFFVHQAVTVPVMRDGHLMIGTLDVCHPATPVLSAHGDMPCVKTGASAQAPVSVIAYMNTPDPVLPQFLLLHQNDRPPKA
jgi:hypothetical protein